METIFFYSRLFLETIIAITGRPKFLKHLVSARRNCFLFFQALIRMEVAFRSSAIAFFRKSFVLASGKGFLINYKLYAFIRSFSLLVDTILEIRCKPEFSSIFSIPNLTAEAVFPGSGKELFKECFIPARMKKNTKICHEDNKLKVARGLCAPPPPRGNRVKTTFTFFLAQVLLAGRLTLSY